MSVWHLFIPCTCWYDDTLDQRTFSVDKNILSHFIYSDIGPLSLGWSWSILGAFPFIPCTCWNEDTTGAPIFLADKRFLVEGDVSSPLFLFVMYDLMASQQRIVLGVLIVTSLALFRIPSINFWASLSDLKGWENISFSFGSPRIEIRFVVL